MDIADGLRALGGAPLKEAGALDLFQHKQRMLEAADEIERLRNENERLRSERDRYNFAYCEACDESRELRAESETLRGLLADLWACECYGWSKELSDRIDAALAVKEK